VSGQSDIQIILLFVSYVYFHSESLFETSVLTFEESVNKVIRFMKSDSDIKSSLYRPVVIDKNRSWLRMIETVNLLDPGFRMIVRLRDLRQVFGSVKAQHRKTLLFDFLLVKPHESDSYYRFKYRHKTHPKIRVPKPHTIPFRIEQEILKNFGWFFNQFFFESLQSLQFLQNRLRMKQILK
jgi:hypothetical protein